MSAPLSKAELRAIALAKRDALSDKQRESAAKALAKRGLPMSIAAGTVISGYSPIRNEIDPAPLMQKLALQGARLALPTVNARRSEEHTSELQSLAYLVCRLLLE